MPFALLIIGIVLLTAGVRDTQSDLFTLVKGDFTGESNFLFWVVSILVIGSLGYIPKLKPISTGFLVLVVLVLFLTKGNPSGSGGGFFAQFSKALGSTQTASVAGSPTASGNTTQSLSERLSAIQQGLRDAVAENLAIEERLGK